MKRNFLIATALLGSLAMQAQKLPCTVQDINNALKEYHKTVTSTSQYLLKDIDMDGVSDIIFRDEDSPSSGYAVLLRKGGKLVVSNFANDGYESLGMAPGGFSFYMHDDHMGPSGRTWYTTVTQYRKGKEILKAEHSLTITYAEDEPVEDHFYSINGKEVTAEKYNKLIPEAQWFMDINDGWRMVKNNQKADGNTSQQYSIYKGTIGNSQITLYFEKDDSNNGYYYYNPRPEARFTLNCVESSHEDAYTVNVVINETAPNGKQTGTFTGQRSASSFKGTFTNYKGQKFDFELYEHYK